MDKNVEALDTEDLLQIKRVIDHQIELQELVEQEEVFDLGKILLNLLSQSNLITNPDYYTVKNSQENEDHLLAFIAGKEVFDKKSGYVKITQVLADFTTYIVCYLMSIDRL